MKDKFFSIGIWHPKSEVNQGTLWRSAYSFGAAFCFTVGARFKKQASDTVSAWKQVPFYQYDTMESLVKHLPYDCPLVGVELHSKAKDLKKFFHPPRACYLLGAEDHGLNEETLSLCHHIVQIPDLKVCLNVSTVGSIIMYDRRMKYEQ